MQVRVSNLRATVIITGVAIALSTCLPTHGAESPEVEKLFTAAKEHELRAEKAKSAAAAKMEEANEDEMTAKAEQRAANILSARALQLAHADANRQRAYQLRNEAQHLLNQAHRRFSIARTSEIQASKLKAAVQDLQKAAVELKDQTQVAQQLDSEAKSEAAEAQRLENLAVSEKTAAENEERHAGALWTESEKLDPEAHRQLAPKPARPMLRPAADR